jgi:hypothetical protein
MQQTVGEKCRLASAGAGDLMAASEIVRAYESFLLGFPNVVGVGTGKSEREGLDEEFIRVYVSRKLPRDALCSGEVLPEWLEGYPVVVEEVGEIDALETAPAAPLSD